MRSHTVYRTFTTSQRREFVRITEDVEQAVADSGVQEGMVLCSTMHITAGVWVNDDEPGILEDTLEWLDKLAPPSWRPPANDVAQQLSPEIVGAMPAVKQLVADLATMSQPPSDDLRSLVTELGVLGVRIGT